MDKCVIMAPAKINLYLDITARRTNGYHDIISIMQTVSLFDEITLELLPSEQIELCCNVSNLPTDSKNIAYRAAELFMQHISIKRGIRIAINKKIPMAAGLGGGSADAAAVLRGINQIYGNILSIDQLCDMGALLGADVPFCVRRGCAKAEGIGEILTELPSMPPCDIVISCPDERISTPRAYEMLDELYGGFGTKEADLTAFKQAENALHNGDLIKLCQNTYNIFESISDKRNDISELKMLMADSGAECAMMSGSGPSVFGIFNSSPSAEQAVSLIEKYGYTAFRCSPVSN